MSIFIKTGGAVGPAGPAGATGPGGPDLSGLVNGYMANFQLDGTVFAVAGVEGGSTADGWLAASDGGYSFNRITNAGFPAQNYNSLAKTGIDGKLLCVQYLNAEDTGGLQNQDVTFMFNINFSVAPPLDFRFGIFSSANGVNNIARPLVAAWNAATVDPTWGVGVTLLSGLTGTWTGGFVTGGIAVNVASPIDNLGFGIWTDAALTVGDAMNITACAISRGATVFNPQKVQKSLNDLECAGLIEKSYELDTAPGAVTSLGAQSFVGGAGSSIRFRAPKLFIPSAGPGSNPQNGFTFFSPVTGAAGMMANITTAADVAAPALIAPSREGAEFIAPGAFGQVIRAHFLANAHL